MVRFHGAAFLLGVASLPPRPRSGQHRIGRVDAAGYFEDCYAVRVKVDSDQITHNMKVSPGGFLGMHGGRL